MIDRQLAAEALAALLRDELVVSSLGFATSDLYAAGDRPENFYTFGSMGTATAIGFGLAMTRPDERVVTLDGDGSLLMSLGVLATVGRYQPTNFACVVFDNQLYQITGEQPTSTQSATDLAVVARGCGIESTERVDTLDDLNRALQRALTEPGPHVVVARVDDNVNRNVSCNGLTRTPPLVRYRFMHRLGMLPETQTLVWKGPRKEQS